jgi:phosphoglycolate phosphatase
VYINSSASIAIYCTLYAPRERIRLEMSLIILDLDGTLVDSSLQIYNALLETCCELNLDDIPYDVFQSRFGSPINLIIRDLNLDTSCEHTFVDLFRIKLRDKIEKENLLYDGVINFLSLSRLHGFKLAIATSKPTYLAKRVVMNSALRNFIDFVQGTDNFPPKPHPEVINRCLQFFKTDQAIMIGDRYEDIIAANSAKIPSVGIAHSFHSIDALTKAGASLAFSTFRQFSASFESVITLLPKQNYDSSL